ncbi:hypothetical protein M011DRAFT_457863 [Sporormia fimetaria CBS 119925]|uniref:Uncharacterized protein n=1 Tax=Sporormia fimetaria CBS 119925 TaxID=1340428 RepID=A0A6A6VDW0_9PLEO|nr:hypothetical protein M011DRAFT_457863 [Sporormia fimetaria CBS 119925]
MHQNDMEFSPMGIRPRQQKKLIQDQEATIESLQRQLSTEKKKTDTLKWHNDSLLQDLKLEKQTVQTSRQHISLLKPQILAYREAEEREMKMRDELRMEIALLRQKVATIYAVLRVDNDVGVAARDELVRENEILRNQLRGKGRDRCREPSAGKRPMGSREKGFVVTEDECENVSTYTCWSDIY